MINLKRFSLSLMLGVGLLFAQDIQAQGDLNFDEFLKAGSEDANTILGEYISPFAKGFGYGMASGWYNTAKTHKPLGFDLTVTMNLAKAPEKDLLFNFVGSDVPGSKYNNLQLNTGGSADLPTIFGGETTEQLQTTYSEDGHSVSQTFNAPSGIDVDEFGGYVPVPMIQFGLGLVKNTDLKFRYIPTQKSEEDGYEIGLVGVGVMHDFKQWIPGLKQLPIDMSVFVGYTKLTTDFDLSDSDLTNDGTASYNVKALTYQALVSKKLSVLTLYAGLGYNSVSSTIEMLGTYEIETDTPLVPLILEDPVNQNFDSSGARATIGARLKLLILTLHADYTIQQYNTLTLGVGLSIR